MTVPTNEPRTDRIRRRRDLVMAFAGALVGAALTAAGMLAFGGSTNTTTASGASTTTTTAPDLTKTTFGKLTDQSKKLGVRIQWTAKLTSGPHQGSVDFVTAQHDHTLAFIEGDTRIVDDGGDRVTVCVKNSCSAKSVADARSTLPAELQPFFDLIRKAPEIAKSDGYRITGEGEFGSGIFAKCGTFDPTPFQLALPDGVVNVQQCLDEQRGVVVAVDLIGQSSSLGGATLQALADAHESDFATS